MIIECEKCASKYNLDENLIKKNGLKVSCSVCKNVFMAYKSDTPAEDSASVQFLDEDLEETVALDSPPTKKTEESGPSDGDTDDDFDKAFEDAMEDKASLQSISADEPAEPDEEATIDIEEAISRADDIEGEISREDAEKRFSEKAQEDGKTVMAAAAGKKSGRRDLLPIIAVVIVLLLGTALIIFFKAPDFIPDSLSFLKPIKKQEITDIGVSQLSFKKVTGSFVENKAGQLFVIKGRITNNYSIKRSLILIRGSLLDNKGKAIISKLVYAGNSFTKKQIQETPIKELNKKLKNKLGTGKRNLNLKPKISIPFMIIFEGLPVNMSEFTVEAVSSSSGK